MGCSGSKKDLPPEEAAEEKRKKAQEIVHTVKATHVDEQKPSGDSAAATKIQKMFRRTATQKAVKFQTNWKVIM